jgi:hypothetical protein
MEQSAKERRDGGEEDDRTTTEANEETSLQREEENRESKHDNKVSKRSRAKFRTSAEKMNHRSRLAHYCRTTRAVA